MTLKEEIEKIKAECGRIALGKGQCWVCGCKSAKRGMVIHHVWYIKNDVTHDQYLPRNDSNVLRYYQNLLPLVKKNPKRFMYLCSTDHQSLERLIRFGEKKFKQLIKARRIALANRN